LSARRRIWPRGFLLRRFAEAKAGDGQVVLLSGEAGIGKSRLTAALLERLTDEPHVRMRYFCSPQHADSALYPIIGHFARRASVMTRLRGSERADAKCRFGGMTTAFQARTSTVRLGMSASRPRERSTRF
jgi:predicted ATPase